MRQFYWRTIGSLWIVILVLGSSAVGIGFALPGGTIAFESNREGNSEIFVADTTRRLLLNVTNHIAQDTNPIWSPDGRRIAFETIGSQRSPRISVLGGGGKTIYVLDMDDRVHLEWQEQAERFTVASRAWRALPRNLQAIEPAWSPDGNQLVVAAWSRQMTYNDIFVVWIYDQSFQQITDTPQYSEYNPAWSPDGDLLSYGVLDSNTQTPSEVYVTRYIERGLGLIRQGLNPLASARVSDFQGASYPTWTPDGRVMFMYSTAMQRLYVTEPDPEAPDMALNDVQLFMEEPRMSPDGEWLVFSAAPTRNTYWRSIYIMRTDGTDLRRITFGNERGSYRDMSPVWRPY